MHDKGKCPKPSLIRHPLTNGPGSEVSLCPGQTATPSTSSALSCAHWSSEFRALVLKDKGAESCRNSESGQ